MNAFHMKCAQSKSKSNINIIIIIIIIVVVIIYYLLLLLSLLSTTSSFVDTMSQAFIVNLLTPCLDYRYANSNN